MHAHTRLFKKNCLLYIDINMLTLGATHLALLRRWHLYSVVR